MTRTNEAKEEARNDRRRTKAGRAAEYGLESAVSRMGGELQGLSVKFKGSDVLMTLRITMPGGPMVAFVGGDNLASCLTKAEAEASNDALTLRVDQYA